MAQTVRFELDRQLAQHPVLPETVLGQIGLNSKGVQPCRAQMWPSAYNWGSERSPKVLPVIGGFTRFKRELCLARGMQMLYSLFSFVVIIQALLVQSIWLMLGRYARNRYLEDIMHFRNPSSLLSRYYGWRTDSSVNAIIEGVMLEFILVGSLIGLSLLIVSIEMLLSQSLIVLFVIALTFLSSLQLAWRVREITKAENRLIDSIRPARDKIGIARNIVENLYSQGEMGDGRVWFAMFRLSLKQDPVGWALRDVLMEKAKEEQEKLDKTQTTQDLTTDEVPGPDIQ